ncbi:MAG: hypothetical protein R3F30_11040 [Planctomycetota bacterium]
MNCLSRLFRDVLSTSPLYLTLLAGLSVSCSGQRDTGENLDEKLVAADAAPDQAGAPDAETGELSEASARVTPQGDGAEQDLQAQRRAQLIEQSMQKARRSAELKLWEDVVKAAADVRALDPSNEEALALLRQAQAALGERVESLAQSRTRWDLQMEIEKQRDYEQAMRFKRDGTFAVDQKRFDDAIESYDRALLTLRYSPWFRPGNELEREVEALAKQAKAEKLDWEKQNDVLRSEQARKLLREEEAKANARLQARVRRLFEEANLAFQSRFYGRSVELLDEALRLEPLNEEAKKLHELAMRAVHDQEMDRVNGEWTRQWTKTFQDLETSDVMQVESIKHDVKHWLEDVIHRKPIEFSHGKRAEADPSDLAVRKVLEDTVVEHNFTETSIEEWVAYYRGVTNLTFLISSKVTELDETSTTLTNFKIGRKSVRAALDIIASISPIRWKVRDGVVWLTSAEDSGGDLVAHVYDVREIVNPLSMFPGRDIQQRIGDADFFGAEPPEPTPIVVDIDKLQELIRANVDPLSWEREGVDIMTAGGSSLIVTQTSEVHEKIDRLLADLRKSSGVQVDIQSRFLSVEDNFLEEVGVDFRGLGDQSSSGKPGMGLANRDGFAFNDYGQTADGSDVGRGFEPGIFYDDGGDGDIYARTENLFDQALGGGNLDNAGGLAFQYTFLDDTEIEVILRAVAKRERVLQLAAPRILVHNTARANLMVTNQYSYIRDFNVEIAQAAAVADPVVDVIRDGIVLDVRPIVSADRRFILMELRPTLARLTLPIPTFTTTLGVGQQVSIQLPELLLQKVRTTVTLPDGGTLLLGGMKAVDKQFYESGIPFLKDLPIVSFFFSKKGTYKANLKTLILLKANIIIPQEHEPVPFGTR